MTSYEVVPEPCFDIFRLPRELPGEIMSRDLMIVKPSNQVINSTISSNSLYEFQLANPAQMMDLNDSMILMSLNLYNTTTPGAVNGALGAVASAFSPAFFRQVQLTIGTTVISSSSTNAGISQYVYNLLRWSKSAQLGNGDLDILEYLDVAVRPASASVYPPEGTLSGSQSVNIAPVLIATTPSQVLTSTALYVSLTDAGAVDHLANLVATPVAGVITLGSLATINPNFNFGFYKRSQKVAYTPGAGTATFVVRIPLNRLFGFCKDGMPVVYGQPINLRFYPSLSSQYIQKTSTTIAYDYWINSMDLFLSVKKPSAAVAARIQEALAAGAKTRLQYNDYDTFSFGAATNQTFTITLGVPSYYLTWLVLTFRPSSYFNPQTATAASPNVGCSICPNPIVNDDVPFTQAYITYGQQIVPAIPYGTSQADLARMYTTYQECCDTLNPAGQGSIIDFEQWSQNHFLLCFDLRNRDITGISGASPATSLTINLQLKNAPTATLPVVGNYQVSATWFACREVEFQATSQGVAIVSV